MNYKRHFSVAISNSLAVLLLLALVVTPFYFAKNFTQVAGVKSESAYLLVSQAGKFPGMTFTEADNSYSISFSKQAPSQAYLRVLILNNPSKESKTYTINNASVDNTLFFGEDLKNPVTKISMPAQTSVPISLISRGVSDQTLDFQISAN